MSPSKIPHEFVRWLRAAAVGPEIRRGVLINSAPILADDPGVTVHRVPAVGPYPVFNPGMVVHQEGFLLVARCSSYVKFAEASSQYLSGSHHTSALLLRLDGQGRLMEQRTVDDSALREAGVNGGVEDVRLFHHGGRIMGIGAAVSQRGDGWRIGQVLFELQGERLVMHALLPQAEGAPPEKNWVPLVRDGQLLFAYSVKPPVFVAYGGSGLQLPDVSQRVGLAFDLRGGTPFIPWGSGYLALVHTSPQWWSGRLHYLHQFICLDAQLRLVEISSPLFLVRRGIEFACGLARRGEDLWISTGLADRHCAVVRVPLDVVQRHVLELP